MAKKYYSETATEVEKDLETSFANGLNDDQAKSRIEKYGYNALAAKKEEEPVYALY